MVDFAIWLANAVRMGFMVLANAFGMICHRFFAMVCMFSNWRRRASKLLISCSKPGRLWAHMLQALSPYKVVFMQRTFTKRIASCVESELENAKRARSAADYQQEFTHLERAHVLGQESTYWHVKVHVLMLVWATRNGSAREALGQGFRIIGAATKTVFGLVPEGNTGGANVSPFKKMPISPELAALIQRAKSGV